MSRLVSPVLHAGGADPSGFLHSNWSPDLSVVVGIVALIAAYLAWTGPLNRRRPDAAARPVTTGQQAAFIGGSLAMLIVLSPPLDDWADRYLLFVHMFQHLVLMFLVVPLWLIGTPAWLLRPMLENRVVARAGHFLTRAPVAFVIANMTVVVWHLPGPYDAALRHEPIHVVQHLSFLGAAILAWWPVLSPLPEWPRLSLPLQCLYLFLESIPGGIVGAFVTLAKPGLYAPYTSAPRLWGLGLETDQQLAGLMMWVLTGLIYLLAITVVFFRWAAREEANERSAGAPPGSRQPSVTSRGNVVSPVTPPSP